MMVIDYLGTRLVECNEIIVLDNEIRAYVSGCEGCYFTAAVLETHEDAWKVFWRISNFISKNSAAKVINFKEWVK